MEASRSQSQNLLEKPILLRELIGGPRRELLKRPRRQLIM